MKIRMAELNIEIKNRYQSCARLCRGYEAEFDKPDISVSVSEAQIDEEIAHADAPCSRGYAEHICIYREIALQLPRFDAFLFHSSVVECDGRGYAFAAASGTGKSTHTALWLKVFGERARVINGDKPIFRYIGDTLYAFGTPWCGKERWGVNDRTPLYAVCFLTRAAENHIEPIDNGEAVSRLFSQVLMPKDAAVAEKFLDLLDRMVSTVPAYLLGCNMLPEAAEVAYRGMQKGENV